MKRTVTRMEATRVIDAHVQFWDPQALHYPWLTAIPALRRTFLPPDLASLHARRLDGVLFVEANSRPEENIAELDFVESLAVDEPRIEGYVAFVNLLDAVGRRRSFHELARRRRVVGVRQSIQGNPSGFALHPEFVRGMQEVAVRELTFDLCVTADQLPEAAELVRQCPDTRFVLDHCGKPSIRTDTFEPWATDLARLARFKNVTCKLSGLLTEARPEQRTHEALLPYVRHAVDCFGAERLIYGSDWPVVTTAGGERAWRVLADAFTSGWTAEERQGFFFENAVRFYRLRANGRL